MKLKRDWKQRKIFFKILVGTWIRHDQNECENMQIGRVVEADSTGLIVEYQDGTNETETLSSSFVKKYFVKTMELGASLAELCKRWSEKI